MKNLAQKNHATKYQSKFQKLNQAKPKWYIIYEIDCKPVKQFEN